MRLSKIKLAGFKSFVDPTTLNLPGNLTGVVGPNGCGKSNIIDAVRWVMGESSAKHLRGSSMDDVIFNGSSSRKPVGIAAVELIFDNSAGKLQGAFASYSEISAKRVITRDGQSKYFLNGTHCRRRDIADLFMGTGLGPRSYAIIEQGMISRLIEAKPEELRNFLEEAAGISKYKERRRETENRIRRTRDNLDRLEDLREEVDKQLNHLKRQSRAAERYKEHKQLERQLKAELLSLRWREMQEEVERQDQNIQQQQTLLEKTTADQRAVESEIEKQRENHNDSNEVLNKIQGEYYKLGADISRLEQTIQHQRELHKRQQDELKALEDDMLESEMTLDEDREKMKQINAELSTLEPGYLELKAVQDKADAQLQQAEQDMHDLQINWDDLNAEITEPAQAAQVERTRMEQFENQIQQQGQRQVRLREEMANVDDVSLDKKMHGLSEKLAQVECDKSEKSQALSEVNHSIQQVRETNVSINRQQDDKRRQLHDMRGRLASLEALQQAALGKTEKNVTQWLDNHGLSDQSRLAENLDVEPGWENAVETVLGQYLEAVCVNGINDIEKILNNDNSLNELENGTLLLLDTAGQTESVTGSGNLAAKVSAPWSLNSILDGVFTADDLSSAINLQKQLAPGESVITPDGIWLGKSWLRVSRDTNQQQGLISREQEIRELHASLESVEPEISALEKALAESENKLTSLETGRDELQQQYNNQHASAANIQAHITGCQTRLEHIENRSRQLQLEFDEIVTTIESEKDALATAQTARNAAVTLLERLSRKREEYDAQREGLKNRLDESKETALLNREKVHEQAIRVESLRTSRGNLEQGIVRIEQQIATHQERRSELQDVLSEQDDPAHHLEAELGELLEKRLDYEHELNDARRNASIIDEKIRELEVQRTSQEELAQSMRSGLEKLRLDAQEVLVRSKTVHEQLEESGHTAEEIFRKLEENADPDAWQEKVDTISQKINRLGPINLAAIDEYKETLIRKEYLDEQNKDVVDALATLEKAIAKIDMETKTRFKETYDHVNSRLNDMFPRLFGGGSAHLEMTDDDLLRTGVTVMAKPPGKRITNIHLLSGGEKALTAVALVFAIFELNPAPFCMLDEVDAPLDEANVGRFCKLVAEMSKTVQFIMITHNKTTMEMTEHMSGVTMREAGVSRLVSVDIAEAAQLAAVE